MQPCRQDVEHLLRHGESYDRDNWRLSSSKARATDRAEDRGRKVRREALQAPVDGLQQRSGDSIRRRADAVRGSLAPLSINVPKNARAVQDELSLSARSARGEFLGS